MCDVCKMQVSNLRAIVQNMFCEFCNRRDLEHAVFTLISTREGLEPGREKMMSCSLGAAYRRHSAVSSSKISLCCLSTIWCR